MEPRKNLLTIEEEDEALQKILSDPDDDASLTLLQLHYQAMDTCDQNVQQESYN